MKQGSKKTLPIYLMLGLFLVITPFSILSAQDEEDDAGVEEIFWGDEEDEVGLDEEFNFSEEDGDEGLEGFEFDDEDGDEFDDEGGDEFDDEFDGESFDGEFDDEFDGESFDDEFDDEPEETVAQAADRLGYTLNLIGASPSFVNHQLRTYNSGMDFRATFEFPMLLEMGPFRFRLGAEVGTFKFTNYKPVGGVFSGVHATGILSFPAGPGQVRIGGGLVGSGIGFIAENSYGMTIGNALDLRIGIRSTTAFGAKDSKKNDLGTVSWLDGILVIGVSL